MLSCLHQEIWLIWNLELFWLTYESQTVLHTTIQAEIQCLNKGILSFSIPQGIKFSSCHLRRVQVLLISSNSGQMGALCTLGRLRQQQTLLFRLSKYLVFPTFSLTHKTKEWQYYFLISMPMSIQEYLRGKVTKVMTATVGEPWYTSVYEKSMWNVTKGHKNFSGKMP